MQRNNKTTIHSCVHILEFAVAIILYFPQITLITIANFLLTRNDNKRNNMKLTKNDLLKVALSIFIKRFFVKKLKKN